MTESKKNKSKDNTQNSTEVFADYARYYDLLYRDKDYAAEAEYVANLIHKFHPAARTILELGSGTGIHANLLAEKGFMIHGIERSQEMLARSQSLAKSRNVGNGQLTFSTGDIRDVRLTKSFDVIIALFHVISYQTTNEDVMAAFESARNHLKPGGIFIFDVWYGPAVLTELPEVRIKRMSDSQIEITRLAEPLIHYNENRVDVNYHMFVRDLITQTVSELKETHVMRYFFKSEIILYAKLSSFKIQNVEEWYSKKAIGTDTWSACFCLQAV